MRCNDWHDTFLDAFSDNEILSDNNVWENTLIVLTSDNGIMV